MFFNKKYKLKGKITSRLLFPSFNIVSILKEGNFYVIYTMFPMAS